MTYVDIDKSKVNSEGVRFVRFRCGDFAQVIGDFVNQEEWDILEEYTIPMPDFVKRENTGRILEIHAKVRLRDDT